MFIHQYSIIGIAILTATACVVPGVFLVLRGVALMSDAISHAILLGIAIMFLAVQSLHSPLLLIGASLAGLLTVFVTQLLINTNRLKEDAAIGLVFPFFFSVGVLLITLFARTVHMDIDMVLLGEIGFAPFNLLNIAGVNCGPLAIWLLSAVALMNLIFAALFRKELAITIFDPAQAVMMNIPTTALFYGLMSLTSITAVAAFDIVGSIVVVCLMITPAATGLLCTRSLLPLLAVALRCGVAAATIGCLAAFYFDVSIAGSIAASAGLIFLGVLLFEQATNR